MSRIVHARCTECQPVHGDALGLCGERSVSVLGITADHPDDFPPGIDPCQECLALADEPCTWCGADW